VNTWVKIIKRLWFDEELYQAKSAASLAHSKRPALHLDTQIATFERILHAARGTTPLAVSKGRVEY
jgi:hypothetical protein